MPAKILVVDDEPNILSTLAPLLRSRGYEVSTAMSGRSGIETVEREQPDLIVLDLGLPDIDGVEVCRTIRESGNVPIVVLSARGAEDDKVRALDLGADDYVTKPFGVAELRARIRVALRHGAGPAADEESRLTAGPIALDVARHEVRVAGRPVDLSPREFEILRVLLAHDGRIVTKGRLLRAVWGQAYQGEHDYVYVHVSALRRKLNAAGPLLRAGACIVTEPGIGYRIRPADG
jgi:two-component system, OmpR family, KDP operon response regulator KdpE